MSMSDETKIPKWVKVKVWDRDNERCIVCGSPYADPNSHIVRRSQGGRGIPENIVTHCSDCHRKYDQHIDDEYKVRETTIAYIKSLYPEWTEESVTFRKYPRRAND